MKCFTGVLARHLDPVIRTSPNSVSGVVADVFGIDYCLEHYCWPNVDDPDLRGYQQIR